MWGLLFWWVSQPAVFQSPEVLAIQPFSALFNRVLRTRCLGGSFYPALLANRQRFCFAIFEEER